MAELTLQLVTWNGAKYLPYLFASLHKQTTKDWNLVVVDNGSKDETMQILKEELSQFHTKSQKSFQIICNKENCGFAVGHNQAFAQSSSNFVQLLNQDVVLAPDYLSRCRAFLDLHPKTAAVQGVLCRWDIERNKCSNVVDSMGLQVKRTRSVTELGNGTQFGSVTFGEIFGVSGALPMYRRKALNAVAHDGEIFDRHFFSYKEDVDLAYRLRSAGWKAHLVPAARAWHDRSSAPQMQRRSRSALERRASYRNHIFTLVKNEHRETLLADWPYIAGYEIKKILYMLVAEWGTLRAVFEMSRLLPVMLKRRAQVMERYRANPAEIKQWFS